MVCRFSDLDNELKYMQKEFLSEINNKLKKGHTKKNIIFLKNKSFLDTCIKTKIASKDFYNLSIMNLINDDTIILLDKNIDKEESINLFIEQLDIYYLIFNLPSFNINMDKFIYFLSVLYDYVIDNNKGYFLHIVFSLNRFVLSSALISGKEIKLIDYIDKLKYLTLFGFSNEEIEEIRVNLNFDKIIQFRKKEKI